MFNGCDDYDFEYESALMNLTIRHADLTLRYENVKTITNPEERIKSEEQVKLAYMKLNDDRKKLGIEPLMLPNSIQNTQPKNYRKSHHKKNQHRTR